MSYTISKTNGQTLVVLSDGVVDTSACSLNLIGKSVSNFGDAQNENFVKLLENFSSNYSPSSPITGQLWYSTLNNINRPAVYDGNNWKQLATLHYSNTTTNMLSGSPEPFSVSNQGDMWFDTENNKLYMLTSTSTKVLIGPEGSNGFNETRLASDVITDNLNNNKPVIKILVDGETIGIMSNEKFQTANTGTSYGFPTVFRGLTLKNYSSSTKISTTSTDVGIYGLLDLVDSSFTRSNISETLTTDWTTNAAINFNSTNSFITYNQGILIQSDSNVYLKNSNNTITLSTTSIFSDNLIDIGTNTNPFNTIIAKELKSNSASLITGEWKLNTNSLISSVSDGVGNIGSETKRIGEVYASKLSAGFNSISTMSGVWSVSDDYLLYPITDNTVDLGSYITKFKTVYTNELSSGSDTSNLGITGRMSVSGNITPSLNNVYNLGSSSQAFASVYANNITLTNANTVNLSALNANANVITANTSTIQNINFTNIYDSYLTRVTKFDKDILLQANLDTNIPTQKAVKSYVDTAKQELIDLINSTKQELLNILNTVSSVKPGTIMHASTTVCPNGYLVCDGSSYNVADYNTLFSVIGYMYGGSGTVFNVPDMRGLFIRSVDNGKGYDLNRTIGSYQQDCLEKHKHMSFGEFYNGWPFGSSAQRGNMGSFGGVDYDNMFYYTNDGTSERNGTPNADRPSKIGIETRPKNIALLPIIKI